MTFQEIVEELRTLKEARAAARLEELAEELAEELRDNDLAGTRRTPRPRADALAQARGWYAEDVVTFLSTPRAELTPNDVLNHRRRAGAWAVARKLAEARAEAARSGKAARP